MYAGEVLAKTALSRDVRDRADRALRELGITIPAYLRMALIHIANGGEVPFLTPIARQEKETA
jgi:antitoxin component of RelBE/YafQ-DinJ toxin-antitoxin module